MQPPRRFHLGEFMKCNYLAAKNMIVRPCFSLFILLCEEQKFLHDLAHAALIPLIQFSAAPTSALFHALCSANKEIKVLVLITTSSNPVRCPPPPPPASRVRGRRLATEGWMRRGKPRTRRYQRAGWGRDLDPKHSISVVFALNTCCSWIIILMNWSIVNSIHSNPLYRYITFPETLYINWRTGKQNT